MAFELNDLRTLPPRRNARISRIAAPGFSLLEMAIVMAIALILCGITFQTFQPMIKAERVTAAYNTTLMTMRRARDQAVAEQREYVAVFTPPGTITVTQNNPGGPLLVSSVLPSDVAFDVEPGIPTSPFAPPTTPDGFGSGALALDFAQGFGGGGTQIYFYPDGSAHDQFGNVNNGVVYIARPGELYSSRAITLWGLTGRLRGWQLSHNTVAGTNYWSQQ